MHSVDRPSTRAVRMFAIALGCASGLTGQNLRKAPLAIGGRVVDVAGKAVACEIILRWRAHPELPWLVGHSLRDQPADGAGDRIVELASKSNEKGRFRIRPPHHGPFLLIARREGESSTQVFPVMPGDYHTLRLEPDHIMQGIVLGADGRPAPGASVDLLPTDGLQWFRTALYNQPERVGHTRADADGRFRIHFEHGYLRDPRWNVLGGVHAHKGDQMTVHGDYHRPTASSRNLTLRMQRVAGIRLKVVDARGRPLAGARVVAPWIRSEFRTDPDGSCAIPAPRGMAYVFAPGYQPSSINPPPTQPRANRKPPVTRVVLTKGVRFTTTLSTAGKPLAKARVLFSTTRTSDFSIEWTVRTDDTGGLDVTSIRPGVPFQAFVEIEGRFVKFYDGKLTQDLQHEPIRVRTDRLVAGRVVALNKAPVAGARVELQALDTLSSPRRVTYTDRAGRFRFDGVFDRGHAVIAAKGEHGQGTVRVKRDDLANPITIEMPKGKEITGRVLDPKGEAVANAWVVAYRSVSRNTTSISGPRETSTTLGVMTDAKGRYRFGGLPSNTSWSVVTAFLRDGLHYNTSAMTVVSGKSNVTLKAAIASR